MEKAFLLLLLQFIVCIVVFHLLYPNVVYREKKKNSPEYKKQRQCQSQEICIFVQFDRANLIAVVLYILSGLEANRVRMQENN